MDNNKFIGFTLIMMIIVTYYTFFPPGKVENFNSNANEQNEPEKTNIQIDESNLKIEKKINTDFISKKSEEKISIENDNLIIDFSSKGGKIINVILKKYLNPNKDFVYIYDGSNGNINLVINGDKKVNLDEIIFDAQLKNNGDSKLVIFTANSIKNEKISISYEIKNNDYIINSSLFLNENFRDQKNIKFSWRNKLVHQDFLEFCQIGQLS